jgi:hypothetical protein
MRWRVTVTGAKVKYRRLVEGLLLFQFRAGFFCTSGVFKTVRKRLKEPIQFIIDVTRLRTLATSIELSVCWRTDPLKRHLDAVFYSILLPNCPRVIHIVICWAVLLNASSKNDMAVGYTDGPVLVIAEIVTPNKPTVAASAAGVTL